MASSSAAYGKGNTTAKTRQSFSIADAKAHFSEVVSTVERRRQPITIMRRGRAIAQIIPMQDQPSSLYGAMRGTVIEVGDIVAPTGGEWSVGGE